MCRITVNYCFGVYYSAWTIESGKTPCKYKNKSEKYDCEACIFIYKMIFFYTQNVV